MTIVLQWLPLTVLLIDLVIKIIALGTIPRNRRPSSSLAWLLLITVTPVFGLILFLLIGSPTAACSSCSDSSCSCSSAARLCVVAGSVSRPKPTK